VLFDLDGTLADTVELILTCFRHTMLQHLGRQPPDGEWLASMGTPLREQMRHFAADAEQADAMVSTYVQHQRALHDRMARPYAGAVELLDALADAAVPVALVTSKARSVGHRTIDCCGFTGRFRVEVFADDVRAGKPDPEPVLRALQELGGPPGRRVLFVGDSAHDIIAGRTAGVRTGAALWGPHVTGLDAHAPDYRFSRVAELRSFLLGDAPRSR
jgi:pyrophosphatase PpaX